MSNGALEKAKNAVVIVVQGAGDVVNASRTAVTDIMLSTLKDAREITGTALGVSRMPSGEPSGQQEVGVEAEQAARAVVSRAVEAVGQVGGTLPRSPGGPPSRFWTPS
jgi:hypothetical protein